MTRRRDQPAGRRGVRGSRGTAALALVAASALAACSSPAGQPCDPAEVFAGEAGPEDVVTSSSSSIDADDLGQTRLLHEQDGFAFFLVQWPEERQDGCLWIESDGEFVMMGCGSTHRGGAPPHGVYFRYDARGEVAEEAPSDWDVVDECLAVST